MKYEDVSLYHPNTLMALKTVRRFRMDRADLCSIIALQLPLVRLLVPSRLRDACVVECVFADVDLVVDMLEILLKLLRARILLGPSPGLVDFRDREGVHRVL